MQVYRANIKGSVPFWRLLWKIRFPAFPSFQRLPCFSRALPPSSGQLTSNLDAVCNLHSRLPHNLT